MWKIAGTMIVVVVGLIVAVPLIIRVVDVLLVPAAIVVGLYLAVRITNARLNRW
jgi:hypothetical protein